MASDRTAARKTEPPKVSHLNFDWFALPAPPVASVRLPPFLFSPTAGCTVVFVDPINRNDALDPTVRPGMRKAVYAELLTLRSVCSLPLYQAEEPGNVPLDY